MLCNLQSAPASCPSLNHSYSSRVPLGRGSGCPLCYRALLLDADAGGFLGTRALPRLSHRLSSPSIGVSLCHHLHWASALNSHSLACRAQSRQESGPPNIAFNYSLPRQNPPNILFHVDGHRSPRLCLWSRFFDLCSAPAVT